ncbi:MAG: hypothetical protein PUD14_08245 [Prevotellaceae bacterium]|nr:hypothetical protein [Prevotellaceae bacterium]
MKAAHKGAKEALPIVGADPCVRPMSERHISTGLASVVRLSALGRHMGLPLQVAV